MDFVVFGVLLYNKNMVRRKQQNNSISRKAAITSLVIGFLFLSITIIRAAWTEPSQPPPAGNAAMPIYSVAPSQTLTGSLSVGGDYTTGLSGTGSTSGVQGNSTAGNAIFGNLSANSAGGQRAVYGLAVDANDYALYASGGLGIGLASGDIWFIQRDAGIGFPHINNAAYGNVSSLKVVASGETQIRSLGGGINFMKVTGASPGTLTSLLTVSEAGVVNVASGGKLQVNSVDVCLKDGTNCSTISTPNLQAVTDAGNSTSKDIISTGLIQGKDVKTSTGDFIGNSLYSRTGGADSIWLGDTNDIIQIQSDLKVGDSGAFGNYDPSATHKVTTPTFYGEQAQIGGATGGLKGAGALNAVQLCIQGNCKGTDWGTVAATRTYVDLPLIDNNDYLCPAGYVMVGVQNTNPAKLICEKLW